MSKEKDARIITIGRCISCSSQLYRYTICTVCRTTFICCESCYSKREVHRDLTRHYRECHEVRLTPQQRVIQEYLMNPDLYLDQYNPPCRRCGECQQDAVNDPCQHCQAFYCSTVCRIEDRERHEEADGECVRCIKHQLAPNVSAVSIRTSILIPDLLAHVISFLSLYQWSLTARVNHAWRNVTLHPSTFPHEKLSTSFDHRIDAPNIGPAHRACFRSIEWKQSDDAFQAASSAVQSVISHSLYTHLKEYSHITSFWYYPSSPSVIDVLPFLPSTLTSLYLTLTEPIDLLAVSLSMTQFTHLRELLISLTQGSSLLHHFAHSVLQQLVNLRYLSFAVEHPLDRNSSIGENEGVEAEYRIRMMEEEKDRVALFAIVSTISLHLSSLTRLSFTSYRYSLSQILASHHLPHITHLILNETLREDTPDADLIAFTQLNQCFTSVASFAITVSFTESLLFGDAHRKKKQLTIDSFIACIDSFGPQLTSLSMILLRHQQPSDQDDFFENDFELDLKQIERLFTRCASLKSLLFHNMGSPFIIEEEVAILARLTPRIKKLRIMLNDVSTTISAMLESLMINFPGLDTLILHSNLNESLLLSPPSHEFLLLRDSNSLPTLRNVTLKGIDLETQVPALLRLLPRIDTLQILNGSISPCRLFEYAQYRPLLITEQLNEYESPADINHLITVTDEQLTDWLDQGDDLNELISVVSIVAASPIFTSSNLDEYYLQGRKLASQSNNTSNTISASSPSSSLSSPPSSSSTLDSHFVADSAAGGPTAVLSTEIRFESHGWMFSRVRTWHWQGIKLDASAREAPIAIPIALPPAFAFYRDRAWLQVDPSDISKNKDVARIYARLDRRARECYPVDSFWD